MKLKSVTRFPDSNSIEAVWVNDADVHVKVVSYSDRQLDTLTADLGAGAAAHADLIAETLAAQQPIPAEPVVVPDVSPRQFRQGLTAAGLRTTVETTIAAADQNTKDWYEYASSFQHDHPVLLALAAGLGVTHEQIGDFFTAWAKL